MPALPGVSTARRLCSALLCSAPGGSARRNGPVVGPLIDDNRAVVDQIHDDEPDTSEAVVRALLATECPQWADLRLQYLDTSGTDNAMWRGRVGGGPDLVVRLPRRPAAADGAEREHQLLQQLAATPLTSIVSIPPLLHVGSPHELYPHRWSVLAWLDGRDAWTARHHIDEDSPRLAARLAQVSAPSETSDVGYQFPSALSATWASRSDPTSTFSSDGSTGSAQAPAASSTSGGYASLPPRRTNWTTPPRRASFTAT